MNCTSFIYKKMNIRLLLYVDFEKTILKIRVLFLLWVFLYLTLPPVSTQKRGAGNRNSPLLVVSQWRRLIASSPCYPMPLGVLSSVSPQRVLLRWVVRSRAFRLRQLVVHLRHVHHRWMQFHQCALHWWMQLRWVAQPSFSWPQAPLPP